MHLCRIPSFYREQWVRGSREAPGISVREVRVISAARAAPKDPAHLAVKVAPGALPAAEVR